MSYIQPHPDFYHSELNLDFSAHSARDGCGGGAAGGGGGIHCQTGNPEIYAKNTNYSPPVKLKWSLTFVCIYLLIFPPILTFRPFWLGPGLT